MSKELIESPPLKRKVKTKENLKQRAYLNSLTGIIDYAVVQLTGFIVSPFIVSGLGSAMYGIWQMLGQMTGYAKIADTRATQVLKWTVAKKKDVVDEEELRSDVTTALAVTIFIVPLVLIAGGIISWYAPYITKAEVIHHDLIRITCSLLILSLVVSKLFDLYESVLRGMNLAFKRMGLRGAIIAAGGGLKVLVITQGYGLIGLSVVQVIITFIIGVTYYYVVRKNVSWFGFGKTSYARILSFSKVSGWYLADTGANIILSNSDKILLGFIASPVVVTYYALTLFLPTALQGMINRVIMGIIPGIGKLLGLKEFEKLNSVLKNINSITFLLTTASGVTIILLNSSFLNAWMGEGYYAGSIANTLIMVMVVQDTFIKHDAYVLSATLDLKKKVFLTLLSGLAFIALGYFLIKEFEIIGLCISIIAAKFLLFNGQRNIIHKVTQHSLVEPWHRRLQPLAISLLMLGLAGYVSTLMEPLGLFEMAGLAPVIFIVSLLLFFTLGLQKESRNELIHIVSSIKLLKSD